MPPQIVWLHMRLSENQLILNYMKKKTSDEYGRHCHSGMSVVRLWSKWLSRQGHCPPPLHPCSGLSLHTTLHSLQLQHLLSAAWLQHLLVAFSCVSQTTPHNKSPL